MRSLIIAAGALAIAAGSGSAQIVVKRDQFAVTPYAGYLVGQSFFKGPINIGLNVQNAPLYGVQASLPLAPNSALVGGIAYSSGDLKAGIPIIGGISVGNTSTTLYDASVELRMPGKLGGGIIPIVEAGGGVTHRTVSVAGITAKTTDFQVSGGVGFDKTIAQNVDLRFMAKDYWGKADFGSVGSLQAKTDDIHAIALSGGVRIAF